MAKVQVVDAVAGACSQICVHLSEPLFDLVLKMVFDYASTNVRSNAVRAIHQLVECVANADPVKTLAKFFPFCDNSIRVEIENGASSLRTTSASTPLPSDATLHWSTQMRTFSHWPNANVCFVSDLAILRGAVYKWVAISPALSFPDPVSTVMDERYAVNPLPSLNPCRSFVFRSWSIRRNSRRCYIFSATRHSRSEVFPGLENCYLASCLLWRIRIHWKTSSLTQKSGPVMVMCLRQTAADFFPDIFPRVQTQSPSTLGQAVQIRWSHGTSLRYNQVFCDNIVL